MQNDKPRNKTILILGESLNKLSDIDTINTIAWNSVWYVTPLLDMGYSVHVDSVLMETINLAQFIDGVHDPILKHRAKIFKEHAKIANIKNLEYYYDFVLSYNIEKTKFINGMLKTRVLNINVNQHDNISSRISRQIGRLLEFENPEFFSTNNLPDILVNNNKKTAIILTGPSVDTLKFNSLFFKPYESIVIANSAILQERLFKNKLRKFVIASDPVFHFSFSTYAQDFRKTLIERLESYSFSLIVPHRDYYQLLSLIPKKFHDRVSFVDFGPIVSTDAEVARESFSDLLFQFRNGQNYVTSNVLSGFCLPLAACIASEIDIYGCDGRKIEDNSYYWTHANSVQYSDKIDSIKACHTDFFPEEYDSYYRKHILQTRSVLAIIENDVKVNVKTETYIPPLHARYFCDGPRTLDLSIIIPAYNAGNDIYRTLRSIKFDKIGFEIVIVDDGSDKDSKKILKTAALQNKNVNLIHQSNGGVSAARNAGLKNSKGKYILFLDAGDELKSRNVEEMVNQALENNSLALSGLVEYYHKGVPFLKTRATKNQKWTAEDFSAGYPVHISGVMMHHLIASEVLFVEGQTNAEDMRYFWELAERGISLDFFPKEVAKYHWEAGSATTVNQMHHAKQVVNFLIEKATLPNTYPLIARPWNYEQTNNIFSQALVALQSYLFYSIIMNCELSENTPDLILFLEKRGKWAINAKRFDNWFLRIQGEKYVNISPKWKTRVYQIMSFNPESKGIKKFTEAVSTWASNKAKTETASYMDQPLQITTDINSGEDFSFKFNCDKMTLTNTGSEHFPPVIFYCSALKAHQNNDILEIDIHPHKSARHRLYFNLTESEIRFRCHYNEDTITIIVNDDEQTLNLDGDLLPDIKIITVGGGYLKRYYSGNFSDFEIQHKTTQLPVIL